VAGADGGPLARTAVTRQRPPRTPGPVTCFGDSPYGDEVARCAVEPAVSQRIAVAEASAVQRTSHAVGSEGVM